MRAGRFALYPSVISFKPVDANFIHILVSDLNYSKMCRVKSEIG